MPAQRRKPVSRRAAAVLPLARGARTIAKGFSAWPIEAAKLLDPAGRRLAAVDRSCIAILLEGCWSREKHGVLMLNPIKFVTMPEYFFNPRQAARRIQRLWSKP